MPLAAESPPDSLIKALHRTLKKVSEDTESLEFNTAIAQMMIYINELFKEPKLYRALWEPFLKILSPYAPHIAEELWEKLGLEPSVSQQPWPQWEAELVVETQITLVCQVNGKIRDRVEVSAGLPLEELKEIALGTEKISKIIQGNEVVKVIAVPDKLVNIVIR
jgi:leucyl-tRNA synthetase